MNVVIIGTGNVAAVLGYRIKKAGHTIVQVFGRRPEPASALAGALGARICTAYDAIVPAADVYIIAVSDRAIEEVAFHIKVDSPALVVHTAGAVSKQVLAGVSERFGVLYPLQSMQASRKEVVEIPFLIDANNDKALEDIRAFGQTLSRMVSVANDEVRARVHVAAVLANNFTNFLFTVAQQYCINENIDFNLLHPLMQETVARLATTPPARSQTGPAVRNDRLTIEKHLQLLQTYPDIKEVYARLTAYIQQWHRVGK